MEAEVQTSGIFPEVDAEEPLEAQMDLMGLGRDAQLRICRNPTGPGGVGNRPLHGTSVLQDLALGGRPPEVRPRHGFEVGADLQAET